MEISDFKLIEVFGKNVLTWKYKAVVTVTTKRVFRKPTVKHRNIFKNFGENWYFVDTGKFVPDAINDLVRKIEAEQGKDLEYCCNA